MSYFTGSTFVAICKKKNINDKGGVATSIAGDLDIGASANRNDSDNKLSSGEWRYFEI